MSQKFKTTRQMRQGAALIKQYFLVYRKDHRKHLDWGRTTPASIRRWIRVVGARLVARDEAHPSEIPHLRHELLRWFEAADDAGIERLIREWPQLRGLSDWERAKRSAAKQNENLARKNPLFAAMGALEEVVPLRTPEAMLEGWRSRDDFLRENRDSRTGAMADRTKLDPDAPYTDDRMSLNCLRLWGRVSLGWTVDENGNAREVDRPHLMLAREVWLASSRDEAHMKEMMGGIFFSVFAHGIENNVIGGPGLRALRTIAIEITGTDHWLEPYIARGLVRRAERIQEAEQKRQERAAQYAPRTDQLLIPLELAGR